VSVKEFEGEGKGFEVRNVVKEKVERQVYEGVDIKTRRICALTIYPGDLYTFETAVDIRCGIFTDSDEGTDPEGDKFLTWNDEDEDVTFTYYPEAKVMMYAEDEEPVVVVQDDKAKEYGL
jgi:hypothetical protein